MQHLGPQWNYKYLPEEIKIQLKAAAHRSVGKKQAVIYNQDILDILFLKNMIALNKQTFDGLVFKTSFCIKLYNKAGPNGFFFFRVLFRNPWPMFDSYPGNN